MESFVTKDDFTEIFNKFMRRTVAQSLTKPQTEYETSIFRQPELYGLPVFVIGYGGRPISYLGQYIAHKVIKAKLNGRIETRWRILTGFVRVIAKHRDDDIYIEVFANGVPSAGVAEWLNNRDQYILIEDRKELNEIECREEGDSDRCNRSFERTAYRHFCKVYRTRNCLQVTSEPNLRNGADNRRFKGRTRNN